MEDNLNTLFTILESAKKEFLDKGYKEASLRNIVKNAGVTTGAFYGYYKSKEELFEAIVEEKSKILMNRYISVQNDFTKIPDDEQVNHLGMESSECVIWMLSYIYENKDIFKLIFCKSTGTKYENFIHDMVVIEEEATYKFIDVLKKQGYNIQTIDKQLSHMLISGYFSGLFEMIVHDMPIEKTTEYVNILNDFYTAGWRNIMGLQ